MLTLFGKLPPVIPEEIYAKRTVRPVFGIMNVYFHAGKEIYIMKEFPWDSFVSILPWLYWAVSLAFNVSLTALIVGRLLWMRSKMCSVLGKEFGRTYSGVAAILYESSLVYTLVVTIGYLTLPGPGGADNMFSPLLAQTEVSQCD